MVERKLIADTDAILRALSTAICGTVHYLHGGGFEDNLLIEVEKIFEAERAAVSVVGGGVERGKTGEAIGLEEDTDVFQNASSPASRATDCGRSTPRNRLQYGTRVEGKLVTREFSTSNTTPFAVVPMPGKPSWPTFAMTGSNWKRD